MTPPDSDAACIICALPATRGLDPGKLLWCDKHGPFYDKPDSDAPRVTSVQLEILRRAAELRARQRSRSGVEVVPEMILRLVDEVEHHRAHCPSRDLAQRILAALEAEGHGFSFFTRMKIAAELRALLVTK